MLARLFLITLWVIFSAVVAAILPLTLAVVLSVFGLVLLVLLALYPDKFLLHYLQARETIESDQPQAYRLARAQAHKLRIEAPKIYTYSGFFHRAFALSAGDRVAFVIERKVLDLADESELEALFFSLGSQVQQRLALRHTLALLVLCLVWAPALRLQSPRDYRPRASGWMAQFLVAPLASGIFRTLFPSKLWAKYLQRLASFATESQRLRELTAKLEHPDLERSAARVFKYRFYAANHTAAQQMILAIEGASHAFDPGVQAQGPAHA